jgi:hypothetical protein
MIFVDVGVRSLLLSKARRSAVTRVFGVPAEGQSFLVTMILLGSVGAVARGLAPGSFPRPSRMHAAIGGSAVDTAVRGIAGAPSKHVPFAGGLIVFAGRALVASHGGGSRPRGQGTGARGQGPGHALRALRALIVAGT